MSSGASSLTEPDRETKTATVYSIFKETVAKWGQCRGTIQKRRPMAGQTWGEFDREVGTAAALVAPQIEKGEQLVLSRIPVLNG